jgi:hypothetical protein
MLGLVFQGASSASSLPGEASDAKMEAQSIHRKTVLLGDRKYVDFIVG